MSASLSTTCLVKLHIYFRNCHHPSYLQHSLLWHLIHMHWVPITEQYFWSKQIRESWTESSENYWHTYMYIITWSELAKYISQSRAIFFHSPENQWTFCYAAASKNESGITHKASHMLCFLNQCVAPALTQAMSAEHTHSQGRQQQSCMKHGTP